MYVELHCHSNFSFLDGASHPDELVCRAKELGMTAVALTDHHGLYRMVKFRNAAMQHGIKPIIGAEITLDNGCHLTILVKNMTGYSNLCRLVSHAELSHGKGQAALDPGHCIQRRLIPGTPWVSEFSAATSAEALSSAIHTESSQQPKSAAYWISCVRARRWPTDGLKVEFRQPFDMIAAAAATQEQKSAAGDASSDRFENWLLG